MSDIFKTAIVEKRNVLNEIRSNNLTLQELRFFSIYLSKINPYNSDTRKVKFKLSDFQKIMDFKTLNIVQLKAATDSLLTKIVHIPKENGGYTAFQLFKECEIDKDSNDEWYLSIDAHDKALPLMFDFKDRYFKYELWNALRLRSANQIRMYEILKQYENIGRRELSVSDLRELLGIAPNEYPRWNNFKARVLDSCQQALKEITDICYTYERGKTGAGGKWLTIIFNIYHNDDYSRQMFLDEFVQQQLDSELPSPDSTDSELIESNYGGELANLLGSCACNDEFTPDQVRVLQDLVLIAEPAENNIARCNYLMQQVHKMNAYNPKNDRRFAYLCRMIQNDIDCMT